jgi:hypothetical protein
MAPMESGQVTMTRKSTAAAFVEEARRAFDYLVTDFGFTGLETEDDTVAGWAWVRYDSPTMQIESVLDPRDRAVTTRVRPRGPDDGWVDLDALVAAAQLVPPKGTHARAASAHGLRVALDAHAVALRTLLPRLTGEGGSDLFAAALDR